MIAKNKIFQTNNEMTPCSQLSYGSQKDKVELLI